MKTKGKERGGLPVTSSTTFPLARVSLSPLVIPNLLVTVLVVAVAAVIVLVVAILVVVAGVLRLRLGTAVVDVEVVLVWTGGVEAMEATGEGMEMVRTVVVMPFDSDLALVAQPAFGRALARALVSTDQDTVPGDRTTTPGPPLEPLSLC